MQIRLQKYLADCGVASRRKAEELIQAGAVTVNGAVVTQLGVKVDGDVDAVTVNGKPAAPQATMYYVMLHKPEGYVTTVSDQFNRPAVTDLVGDIPARLFPVGRLDYNSSGLLLLTNDGALAYRLTHPKHNIPKVYIARVRGVPTAEALAQFRRGLDIDGRKTAPAQVQAVKQGGDTASLRITITEGRNRQVRKMCDAIGHPVLSLKRIATGKLYLGELPKGAYRYLTEGEVSYLKGV